ncbi:MAG: hypothetical protein RIS79_4140 [Verrucomicrobiota bacterium]
MTSNAFVACTFRSAPHHHRMKTLFTILCMPLLLASCAAPAVKDKPADVAEVVRCNGCGRAITSPKDMRGEMCSMCDWRLGADIGWP